jgi:glycine cleavage system H protein
MANVPADLRYTEDHEWAKKEGEHIRVGITEFAQEQLGDVVFVELPKLAAKVAKHGSFGVVESVKAVSDLFAPVSGEIVGVNERLSGSPELVNQHPYDEGWMIVIAPSSAAEWDGLLTAAQYEDLIAQGGH